MDYEIRGIRKWTEKRGQAAIFISVTLVAFLAFAGLTIDMANMYLAKAKLQAALDAASIGGLTALVNNVSQSDANAITDAENSAKEIAEYNLRNMALDGHIDPPQAFDVIPVNTGNFQIRILRLKVSGQASVRTLFVGMLFPGILGMNIVPVTASSTAERKPSMISLVLDYCADAANNQIGLVKSAALSFVDVIPANIDQLGVRYFCQTTDPLNGIALQPLTDTLKTNIVGPINAQGILGPSAFRNTSEAIQRGREQITNVLPVIEGIAPGSTVGVSRFIVLITSGSPNVMRGDFLNPEPLGGLPVSPTTSTHYNYYVNAENNEMTDSEFINPPRNPIQDSLVDFSYSSYNESTLTTEVQGFVSPGVPISKLDIVAGDEVRKEVYDLAIIEADYAKNFVNPANGNDRGIAVYTIGANAAPESIDAGDAYQNVNDINSSTILKPYFLRRLANVRDNVDPAFEVGGAGFDRNQPEGRYLPKPTDDQVKNFSRQLNTRNKIRLVN